MIISQESEFCILKGKAVCGRWSGEEIGEQEGRKKDGDRDVQELKEVTGRLIFDEALFLLQCHQQKLGRC